MGKITVSIVLPASPDIVWSDVKNIASHVEWMADAESITITSSTTIGVGTTFDCLTKIGPIRLTDQMVVTAWEEERVMGVRHVGLVTGTGQFTLEPEKIDGDTWTRFTWSEELRYPWWLGAAVGGLVGDQILKQVWKRNLKKLRARF